MITTSIKYFNQTVCEFREQMGLKTFWANRNKVESAKKALCHVYFNMQETPENNKTAHITFEATLLEFTKRALLIGYDL